MARMKAPKLAPVAVESEPVTPSPMQQMVKGMKKFKSTRTTFDIARPKRPVVTRYSR